MRALLALLATGVAWAAPVFDVSAYGAQGNARANDTAAIQKAIDTCHQAGGGVVLFPAGQYVAGTIVLKSNVTLHLTPGSVLRASGRREDYNPRHFIYARNVENIAIEGGGAIDGNGQAFWRSMHERPEFRPSPLIELVECRDVSIRNVRIFDAPGWVIHPLLCDGVTIRGVTIDCPMFWLNTDGIDPDSSRNVRISDCYIRGGDDCIVLKTTGRMGLPAPACENITVTNCVLVSSASALKLGTESHGDIRNCTFTNCVIRGSRTGIALLAKDGGTMENIRFSNIVMETQPKHNRGVEWPIVVDLEKRNEKSRLSTVRGVTFNDVQIYTRGRVLVAGMAARHLEEIEFRNVRVRVSGFEQIEKVRKLRGGTVKALDDTVDFGPVPAAMIFGFVRGLRLDNVSVEWDGAGPAQERHAIYATGVRDLRIKGFHGRQASEAGRLAAIGLDGVRDVFVSKSQATEGGGVFLGLHDVPPSELVIESNDLRGATQATADGHVYVHSR